MSYSPEPSTPRAVYKLRVDRRGNHTGVTVFSRAHHSGDTYANCGSLIFNASEWESLEALFLQNKLITIEYSDS
jgi:hypothetical protein